MKEALWNFRSIRGMGAGLGVGADMFRFVDAGRAGEGLGVDRGGFGSERFCEEELLPPKLRVAKISGVSSSGKGKEVAEVDVDDGVEMRLVVWWRVLFSLWRRSC